MQKSRGEIVLGVPLIIPCFRPVHVASLRLGDVYNVRMIRFMTSAIMPYSFLTHHVIPVAKYKKGLFPIHHEEVSSLLPKFP